MPNDTMMKIRIKKLLTITPGSIAGVGSPVTVTYEILSVQNCDELVTTYRILGPGADGSGSASFRFAAASKFSRSPYHLLPDRSGAWTSYKNDGLAPIEKRLYGQKLKLEPNPDYAGEAEASLKIVASVQGVGKAKLDPVHSIGSIAVLSVGLEKLMKAHYKDEMPAGRGKAFLAKAREFVKLKLDEYGLEKPGVDTVLAAIEGETAHRVETLTGLDDIVNDLKRGVTDRISDAFSRRSAQR